MANYVPKHRHRRSYVHHRRFLSLAAFVASLSVALSSSYGFVDGAFAATNENTNLYIGAQDGSIGPDSGSSILLGPDAQNVAPTDIDIAVIGLSTKLIKLGLNKDGSLEAPKRPSQAGWFSEGVAPGAVGPAIIAGHVDSYLGPAVFSRLTELNPGDEVIVTRADSVSVKFAVDRIDRYPKDHFPTDLVYGATSTAQLRLITCGGSFDRTTGHYRDNVVVYATKVS